MADRDITFLFDVEGTGKDRFLRVRPETKPPRVTQAALFRMEGGGTRAGKMLIGGDASQGWTDLLTQLVERYGIDSPEKLPPDFWRELSMYDPSVRVEGSLLNRQVRDHVAMIVHMRSLGQKLPSGADLMEEVSNHVRSAVSEARAAGGKVHFAAYSRRYDLGMMFRELAQKDPATAWMVREEWKEWSKEGVLSLTAAEENVHRAMFEKMLRDPKAVPVFSKGPAFDVAIDQGLTSAEITLEKHAAGDFAKRSLMDDIIALSRGGDVKGMPAAVRRLLEPVANAEGDARWEAFKEFQREVSASPLEQDLLRGYYANRAAEKVGKEALSHAYTPWSMEYMLGWKQESVAAELAKILTERGEAVPEALGEVAHRAGSDVLEEAEIMRLLERPELRDALGERILSPEYQLGQVQQRFGKFAEEKAALRGGLGIAAEAVTPLAEGASLLSRMGRYAPQIAVAAGVVTAGLAIRDLYRARDNREAGSRIAAGIQALRTPVTPWDAISGIRASELPGANQSDFGSGRRNGPVFAMTPEAYQAQLWYEDPSNRAYLAESRAWSEIPRGWSRLSDEEVSRGKVDLSQYVAIVEDADTLSLHRAWLNRSVPLLGPAVGEMQKAMLLASKTLTGVDAGVEVRVHGIDAPETPHSEDRDIISGQPMADWSTRQMARLMEGATSIRLMPGETYGRYIGAPMAGGRDISRDLVRMGGAVALSIGSSQSPYKAEEDLAWRTGAGIHSDPYFKGYMSLKRRTGTAPPLNQLVRRSRLATSREANEALASAMLFANHQRASIRDTYAQNAFVQPAPYLAPPTPVNLGRIYS